MQIPTRQAKRFSLPICRLVLWVLVPWANTSCNSTKQTLVDRSSYASLFEARNLDLLLAVDRIEDGHHLAAAPWLLWLARSEHRSLRERSRAAAALARFGFREGQEFCLAILAAWLPGHEAESRKFDIPRSERMAFSRELALLALRDLLQQQGQSLPPYDVNQGAPQMKASVAAIRNLFARLPAQQPRPSELSRLFPERAPREWTRGAQAWADLRSDLLAPGQ